MSTNLIQIAPALIARSLTNPRKTFDQAKLAELAESIKASGLHQPVLVRPLPASRMEDTFRDRPAGEPLPTHELVVGERRWRASTIAEKAESPAIVRELTDAEAEEIQVIENLQRDDLAQLEEAEGYEHLMQRHGLNADQVAAKIGKSRSYVYARLKLLDVPQAAKEAMRAGELDNSKALEIARVPTEKLQLRALEEATRQNHLGETCSVRVLKGWIRNNLMLKLDTAVFDIKDAKLCAEAGSCLQCQKRTGADPDLFADVDSPDVCTDITCYHEKVEAHSAQVVAKAKKRGLEIIDGEEARKEVPYPGAFLRSYAPLDEKIDSDVDGDSTLRHHMTKDELKQVKLLIDPFTKQPREVVPEELAEKVHERLTAASAKASGKQSKSPAAKAKSVKDQERELAFKRSRLEERFHKTWHRMAFEQIAPRVRAEEINSFDPAMLRAVMFHQVAPFDPPAQDDLVAVMDSGDQDLDEVDSTIKTLASIDDLSVGQTLIMWLLRTEIDPMFEWNNGVCAYMPTAPMIEACAARLGIDLEAIRSEVKEDMRAEFAELDPPSEPLPSAAPATETAAGKPKKGGSKKSKATPTPQLSIEDAKQGIAAAMQNDEAAADDGRGDLGGSGGVLAGLAVGQKVRFVEGLKSAGGKLRKVSGRAGVIKTVVSPGRYVVKYGDKPHEEATADAKELDLADDVDEAEADDGPADQGGSVVRPIVVGDRVRVVGNEMEGNEGTVTSITSKGVHLVRFNEEGSDFRFEPVELVVIPSANSWPFPPTKGSPVTDAQA